MTDKKRFHVFATSRIGDPAENRLRGRGYELEVFEGPEAPPKKLIIEKVKSGIDGLITTLRDPIDHRHRTHRPGDDQEVLGFRHEHAVLRPGVSQ
jgi:hypothetical protein